MSDQQKIEENNQLVAYRQAASFDPPRKILTQVKLVIDLLVVSSKEGKQISIEDVMNLYVDWKICRGDQLTDSKYNGYEWRQKGYQNDYTYFEVSREQFLKKYDTRGRARDWFKKNLGAAIIAGHVLAIPVINLDENK